MNASMFRIIIFILFLSISAIQANEIDSIETDVDVNLFMAKHFGDKYNQFIVADTNTIWGKSSSKLIADTLGMKYWYKTDFNQDSRMDLLVYGSYFYNIKSTNRSTLLLAIIDKGDGNYQTRQIRVRTGLSFPVISENNSEVLILLYRTCLKRIFSEDNIIDIDPYGYSTPRYDYSETKICVDTLIYKFSDFVKYNSSPLNNEILKFRAKNSCSMIACYVMDVEIQSDGQAKMLAGEYYEDKILYEAKIDSETLKEIFGLINYIDPKNFLSEYPARTTDASYISSEFTYTNGRVKKIIDYRKSAFGLRRLYELFFELRSNQSWKK